MKTAIPFNNHVERVLNPYKWGMSLLASLIVAVFFSLIVVKGQVDSNNQILSALSPYVGTLSDSSDRPEILRVLINAARASSAKIILVKDGNIFGTSGSPEELDSPFNGPKIDYRIFNVKISNAQIISSAIASRYNGIDTGARLYVFSDLWPTLRNALGIFIVVFLVCMTLALFSSVLMKKAIKKALKPLDQLHQEIEMLPSFDAVPSEPINVSELESIRQHIVLAKVDLENAKDKLAEEKAQKMSARAFKQLIHDLHNPVAALRTMVKLAFDSKTEEADKEEIFDHLSRIADQILGQVTAAKKNLEEEPVALRETDVLSTVAESVRQLKVLTHNKKIVTENTCATALVAHDPELLKRALVNLLENALSAARGIVRVTVNQDVVGTSICVCDDGLGMDESLIPLYFQGRGMSGKANRQAFGLSSTNHIVRSHGGKLIYRKSNLGGSSFEIRLGAI